MIDRRSKRTHRVYLYRAEQLVGTFDMPHTDPRFIKGEDLLELAFEKTRSRPNQRWNDLVIEGGWDKLVVYWSFASYSCNQFGTPLREIA